MKNEIRKRKKRFWAFCLALMLVFVQSVPIRILAETYTLDNNSSLNTNTVQPGDIINYDTNRYSVSSVEIAYLDYDGTVLDSSTTTIDNTATIATSMTVKEYTDLSGVKLPGEQFKEWEIKEIDGSGSCLSILTLQAVAYVKSNIIYHIDGTEDTDTYYEGKGLTTLNQPSKNGYTFDGWYADEDYSEQVVSISAEQTGDIDLYGRYIPETYTITYELDGGTNNASNPSTYTYGTGVASLADATKTGYTFDGWYIDKGDGLTKVDSILNIQIGDITLYAKYTANTYNITYNLNGGTNAASNPTSYICGTGVSSFADAIKAGYTFEGWYSDVALTTEVTSIPSDQYGDITLYAKYTVNTYGITYNLNGGTNNASNPTAYTYGTGVTSFANATKDGYTFEGWYSDAAMTTKVTSISATQTGAVTLYAKFTEIVEISLKDGVGTIAVGDIYYGGAVNSIVTSSTNGINNVTIEYKLKGEPDSSYTKTVPVKVGDYTARATFAQTAEYLKVTATDDFSIKYLNAPATPYRMQGTKGDNDYYKSIVTILPATGYLIADKLDGVYRDKLEISQSKGSLFVYLKEIQSGAKTSGISVSEIKIDKDAPVILNAPSEEVVYGESTEITITDDNLVQVLVNGNAVEIRDGKATLKLLSNQGEEKYQIISTDSAGNRSELNIVVAAEWMKTKIIPSGENVRLSTNSSYMLGSGSWKVNGDSTTYAGNTTFYVNHDGEYSFSEVK